jgi:hypothetical protein
MANTKFTCTLPDGKVITIENLDALMSEESVKSTEGFGFKQTKKMYNSKKEFINSPELKAALSNAKAAALKKKFRIAKKSEINTVASKVMSKFRDPKGTEQKTKFEMVTLGDTDLLLVDANNPKSMNIFASIIKGFQLAGAQDIYDVNAINKNEQNNQARNDVNRGYRHAYLYIFFLNAAGKIGIKELGHVKYSTTTETIEQ